MATITRRDHAVLAVVSVALSLAAVPLVSFGLSSPAQGARVNTAFRVATANIKFSLTRAEIVEDVNKVAAVSGVILWQEMRTQAHNDAIRALSGWRTAGLNEHDIPISFRATKWSLRGTREFVAFSGNDVVTPRYMRVATLRHRQSGIIVRFVNTHLVARCRWGEPEDEENAPLREAWRAHWRFMNRKIDSWAADGRYYRIVGGGDYNRRDTLRRFTPKQEWYVGFPIDKLWGAPARKLADLGKVPNPTGLNTDHGPRIRKLRLVR